MNERKYCFKNEMKNYNKKNEAKFGATVYQDKVQE